MSRYKLGIDVGGTFTDLFLAAGGEVETFKVLSTPQDPSIGVLEGLETIARAKGVPARDFIDDLSTIVHGTTVTTNAVLTRRGARTGLLTTAGVRDALEMRRGIREKQYDNRYQNVEPLVPRWLRLPVHERVDWRGEEAQPIELDDVRDAIRTLKKADVAAVAICFLNSFANPAHELAAAEIVREEMPEAFVSVSTELLPTIRFYNRVSTTVLNAYSGPVLDRYLSSLTRRLSGAGFSGVLLIMQSSGGVALPEATAKRPATTLLSGPAGGPNAAVAVTRALGHDGCLLVDMGGTSFDASLVQKGKLELRADGEIGRLRTALPMLDIATIGAGGGSIGHIDSGGLLRMGPESAGADPGPACYGRGGQRPTCTDANILLGYLDPGYFAGGGMKLDAEAARRAVETDIAKPLGLDVERAAVGMYRVINTNMAHGVREITVRRGLDPREFPLVVAGGAGSVHACMIAAELEIPTVVVPAFASVLCAAGMLMTDLAHDFARSLVSPVDALGPDRLESVVSGLEAEGQALLEQEGVPGERIGHQVSLDLRYLKQYHEVTVPVPRAAVKNADWETIAQAFHAEHDRLYGYELSQEGTRLEIINVRVRSVGTVDKPPLPRCGSGDSDPGAALKGRRRAFVPEHDSFEEIPVYDGHKLLAGSAVAGPALIERTDTTLFVSAAYRATVDEHATCVLSRVGGAS
jgi:N-methylhydantoinase A